LHQRVNKTFFILDIAIASTIAAVGLAVGIYYLRRQ
jgi:hypothetical protein